MNKDGRMILEYDTVENVLWLRKEFWTDLENVFGLSYEENSIFIKFIFKTLYNIKVKDVNWYENQPTKLIEDNYAEYLKTIS